MEMIHDDIENNNNNNNNNKSVVVEEEGLNKKATVKGVSASQAAGLDERVQELIRRGSLDFATWISLISKIEKIFPDNLDVICSVYDSFLLEFPLCHEYWEKYVAHKARLCTIDKLVEIYERAVQSASYCVNIWVEYCSFGILAYKDPSDVRRLFKRAISLVGKDYLCHPLWDKYFEFEFSQQQWSFLAQIYVQALKFPTEKLHRYYDNFKKFVDILEEEMKQHFDSKDVEMESAFDTAVITSKDDISSLIDNLLHPSTGYFRKYISIGERYYRDASELDKKIFCFETNIQRSNFDVTPVDDAQLENWRQYLDFVENQGDFDWAVKLYERCLIPCSGYPEFWMRYVEYTETKGGRELAKFSLDRATKIFLKNSPEIYYFNAQFKELKGDKTAPHTTLVWSDSESCLNFVEKVVREANREKRMGNFESACAVYDKALEIAAERKKLHTVSNLYVHFARLIYVMTGKRDQARGVIIKGLKHLPYCKILLEGLINFLLMHGDIELMDLVDHIVADAISDGSQGLSNEDRQDISSLYLQFVDLCGTIHDIKKVWFRHIRLFPNLVKPSFSDKLHRSDNQLLEIEEPFPENHALQTNKHVNTTNQAQPEDDNDITKENLSELSPKDTSKVDQITQDLVDESTQDVVCEVANDAEKGQKCLSLVAFSLNDQEMERGDFVASESCSNVSISSPSIARQGKFHDALPNQSQNEQLNRSSLDNHENAVTEQAEMDTHVPKSQGGTQGYPTDTHSNSYSQDIQQQNTIPVLQSQPSTLPAFHLQAQTPQFQMQSGGDMGYNQPYNDMTGYYYQQQQYMQQQQYYMQQQQYMQQAQQQPNMVQTHDQHMLYVQQQQQLAQMYYQQPQQMHAQQALLYQQFYQGQQAMTQYDPSSSGVAEPPHPPKQSS